MKVIDWSKVITNVVSAVCVMIVTSAGIIMWREATSVQDRVNEAKQIAEQNDAEIREQTEIIREIVDLIQEEMIEMTNKYDDVVFGLSSSMATNVIVDELYDIIGNKCTMIDFGSIWDPFVGSIKRSYHKQYEKTTL